MLLITTYLIKKEFNFIFEFQKTYAIQLIKTALPYGLALILMTFYFKIDIILVQYLRSNTEAGIYGVPLKLMEILSVISIFFMNSALPSMTQSFKQGYHKLNQSVQKAFVALNGLAAPILVGGIILAFPLIFSITSPQFLSGYHCSNNTQVVYQNPNIAQLHCPQVQKHPTFADHSQTQSYFYRYGSDIAFKIILIGLYFSFLNTLFAFSLVASQANLKLLKINFFGFLLNLTLNLIFIPKYGFIAASVTTAICEFCVLGLAYRQYQKASGFRLQKPKILKTYLASLVMGVFLLICQPISYKFMQNFNLIVLIPCGSMVYFYMIHKLNVLDLRKIKNFSND